MSSPVKVADRIDLIRELDQARDILVGWAERIAATPGDDAAFLLKALDNAASSAGRAVTAARVAYPRASGFAPRPHPNETPSAT